jgi:hypothetical protein
MALERVDGDGSGFARPKLGLAFAARHAETLLVLLVLIVALVIGLATAADYGLSTDEFNTDDYGPKALAWYICGCMDRGFRCSSRPCGRLSSRARSRPGTP